MSIEEIKKIKLFLLDMDGTIYHENSLIPGTIDFFDTLQKNGIEYAFMSNNSSKGKETYLKKLSSFGIEASEKQIVSSITVTIQYLKDTYCRSLKIYLVGTESFKLELEQNGHEVVSTDYRGDDIDLCLLGFDTELSYAKLEGMSYYLQNGIEYIATNCDLRCPVKNGKFIPDCGSIARMLELTTGRQPKFLGKPEPEMVFMASKIFNVSEDEIMCVGDRLYTDIAVGINAGSKTALVLTGEATKSDVDKAIYKPTYVFESIKVLAENLKKVYS